MDSYLHTLDQYETIENFIQNEWYSTSPTKDVDHNFNIRTDL